MAPPSNGGGRASGAPPLPRGSRQTNPRRAIVPAIPLPLMQRRPKPPSALQPAAHPPTAESVILASTSSSPLASSPAATTPTIPHAPPTPTNGTASATVDCIASAGVTYASSSEADFRVAPLALQEAGQPAGTSSVPPSAALPPSTSQPPPHPNNFQFDTSSAPFSFPAAVPSVQQPLRPLPQPLDQRRPLHHPRPSDGSLVFGLQDSNNTSPAPHSGGIFPPPGVMPYGAYGAPTMGDWGRHMPPFAEASNGYPAMAPPSFHPSSPHSFHGSQSSAHAEENGYTHTPNGVTNDQNGGVTAHNNAPAGIPAPQYPPISHGPQVTDADPRERLCRHLQDNFTHPDFPDCVLFFSFQTAAADQQPFSFAGSRVILAQSPMLKELFRSPNAVQNGPLFTFGITLADRYISSESLQATLGTMYGLPLKDFSVDTNDVNGRRIGLTKALAMISAGSLFNLPLVKFKGMHLASRYIDWANIETALEFCLDATGGLCTWNRGGHSTVPGPLATFKYAKGDGQHVRELLLGLTSFTAHHFPPDFVLDRTVTDAAYARIPQISASSTPTIAHGTSGPGSAQGFPQRPHSSRLSQDPRFSHIRFGDLSPPTANGSPPSTAFESVAHAIHSEQTGAGADCLTSILSRILLNLPYEFLTYVLESSDLGDTTGWVRTDDRRNIVHSVIAEREARRLGAIEAVRAGRVPDSGAILKNLESRLSQQVCEAGDKWDVIGFQEEVVPGTNDAPRITRKRVSPKGVDTPS